MKLEMAALNEAELSHPLPSDRVGQPSAAVIHIALFTCLILQRFGLSLGNSSLSISVPVLLGLGVWMFIVQGAKFDPARMILFILVVVSFLVSTIIALVSPANDSGVSIPSLLYLLLIYPILALRPPEDFDHNRIHQIFLLYARICAALGVLQFAFQLFGIQLYSFSIMMPWLKPILIEQYFNFDPVLAYGSTSRRSNGFFLLEPAVFSQLVVVAIVLDFLILGKLKYLPLYCIAYMTSFSGTGLLTLSVVIAFLGLTSLKNFSRSLLLGVAALIAGIIFALSVPEQFHSFANRVDELSVSSQGSSGYARYASQGEQIQAIIQEGQFIFGFGPGATQRSKFFKEGSGNSLLHLFFDYGFLGTLLFTVFLIKSALVARHAALSVLFLALFIIGGDYLSFAPFTLLFVVLVIWAPVSKLGSESSQVRQGFHSSVDI